MSALQQRPFETPRPAGSPSFLRVSGRSHPCSIKNNYLPNLGGRGGGPQFSLFDTPNFSNFSMSDPLNQDHFPFQKPPLNFSISDPSAPPASTPLRRSQTFRASAEPRPPRRSTAPPGARSSPGSRGSARNSLRRPPAPPPPRRSSPPTSKPAKRSGGVGGSSRFERVEVGTNFFRLCRFYSLVYLKILI